MCSCFNQSNFKCYWDPPKEYLVCAVWCSFWKDWLRRASEHLKYGTQTQSNRTTVLLVHYTTGIVVYLIFTELWTVLQNSKILQCACHLPQNNSHFLHSTPIWYPADKGDRLHTFSFSHITKTFQWLLMTQAVFAACRRTTVEKKKTFGVMP